MKREHYWNIPSTPSYPSLAEDIRCDCLVIGGGICGVLTAHLLSKRGIDTVLIEKGTLGCGRTAGTTAKATLCHDLTLSRIRKALGTEAALQYTEANREGLRLLRELLLSDNMDCDGETADFFLYSIHGTRRLSEEYHCLRDCGIDCDYAQSAPGDFELPLSPLGVIHVRDQLQFHPLKALHGIAANMNARIFEHTEADQHTEVRGGHLIRTRDGCSIHAGKVIAATNYPVFMPRHLSFLRLYRETSYSSAFLHGPRLRGMYFGTDGGYAFRSHGDTLLISGERHRLPPVPNAAERLNREADHLFSVGTPAVMGSDNDSYTHDGVPYVGEVGKGLFLAAGFNGWGMTNAAGAALMLSYLAAGETLPFGGVFAPFRSMTKGGGKSLKQHMGITVSGMAKSFTVPSMTAADVKAGYAAIINYNGRRTGAYREENGTLHLVSLKCPHLGCSLTWNDAAKTWDCPCHGSRFDADGICISDPARKDVCVSPYPPSDTGKH